MNNIQTKEIKERLKKEQLNIIDIRERFEYLNGNIPSSNNINKILLLENPEIYLNKNTTYYIYCNSGNTSAYLVYNLNKKGYHTVNIIGGYNNYLLEK